MLAGVSVARILVKPHSHIEIQMWRRGASSGTKIVEDGRKRHSREEYPALCLEITAGISLVLSNDGDNVGWPVCLPQAFVRVFAILNDGEMCK